MDTQALKKIVRSIDSHLQDRFASAFHQVVAVGIMAFVSFPLFYWLWTEWFPQPYESFTLRALGSALGLGLILAPFWPERIKFLLPWYWFFSIFYLLAFFFAYLFLMNHASVIAGMSLLCSVFLLVLLVDLPSMLVFIVLGWSLALICHYLNTPIIYYGEEHAEMVIMVTFVIIAGSALNHKTTILQQQRLGGMAAAAGMIAHELRTPLLGIKSGAIVIKQYLPRLLDAYYLAKEHGLLKKSVRENRFQQLAEISERIINETDYANTIIDMLLVKAGRDKALQNCVLEECSLTDCLMAALERYPFKSSEQKALISWQGEFTFIGSKLLMQHVLFNLLKNALYAIEIAQKGEIVIWAVRGEKFNSLYFKDTAKGIPLKQQSQLFNHFHTTTFMGTGLGLSFCKMVMNRFGGDISCEAKEGFYTQFMLMFPVFQQSASGLSSTTELRSYKQI